MPPVNSIIVGSAHIPSLNTGGVSHNVETQRSTRHSSLMPHLSTHELPTSFSPAKYNFGDFIGALSLKKSKEGTSITTSNFSKESYDDMTKSEKNIVLIDCKQLVRCMIENDVGIKIKETTKIKEIDDECFE